MTVLDSVLDVFEKIAEWMINAFDSITPMFFNDTTGLTFLGVLAVSGLAVSIILLIISIVQGFLHFRG